MAKRVLELDDGRCRRCTAPARPDFIAAHTTGFGPSRATCAPRSWPLVEESGVPRAQIDRLTESTSRASA
jgi:hypothetical protein